MQPINVPENEKTFVTIWVCMLLANVVYYVIGRMLPIPENATTGAQKYFLTSLVVMSAAGVVYGAIHIWFKTNPKDIGEDPNKYKMRSQIAYIIGLATFEAVGIYGLILLFLGIQDQSVKFYAASFILFLAAGTRLRPMFNHLEELTDIQEGSRNRTTTF